LADTNEPVSMLPARGSWLRRPTYRIVSSAGHSTLVDESTAASLSPIAHILYPPLPDRTTLFGLFRFAVKPHRRDVLTALLTGVAITLLGMLTPQAIRLLFEYAVPDADRTMLAHIGLALIVAATGSLLFDLVQAISIARLVTSAGGAAQMGLWDRLLQASPSFFRQFTAGEIENRANGPTEIKSELDETTLKILLGSVVSLLNVALLFYYSARLAVVAVALAAVALAVNAAAGALMIRIVRPLEELDGQLRGLLVQLLNAASKIRIAGAEPRAFAQWARAYTEKQRWTLALQTHSDRLQVFGMTLAPLATALLFWVAFTDLFDNPATSLSLGTFLAFLSAFGTFLAAAITLGDSSAVVLRVAAVWKRVAPILETEREFQGQKRSPGELTGRIRMEHVTFRYREDGPPTLDDVTIEAEPGECIAIVGPSGSGKSTLINLLLRFEVPLSGTITYDGHDLNTLDVLEVRRQLGVVSQENKIMAGSLYDNIVCGSLATIEDAWKAARAAGFDEDIQQMAMQMHTVVSEGGGNLSGGQRQRLLIARALVQQPRIVILDEATSALDNNTQAVVMDSLNKLQATRIIVAHRLSTVRLAHRVYVLDAGRVVQRGTFDDLMREEGLFARLMRRQAL
jgi:NHLM bacteriocin system ABC transporter ATP-binding protein